MHGIEKVKNLSELRGTEEIASQSKRAATNFMLGISKKVSSSDTGTKLIASQQLKPRSN
jgi:hypothetical protein